MVATLLELGKLDLAGSVSIIKTQADLTYLILTGGQSKRFGAPKRDAQIDGATFLELIVSAIPEDAKIIVSGPVTSHLSRYVIQVDDEIEFGGPVSGIHSGLFQVTSSYIAIIAVDMPFAVGIIQTIWDVFNKSNSESKSMLNAMIPLDNQGIPQYLAAIYKCEGLRAAIKGIGTQSGTSMRRLITYLDSESVSMQKYKIEGITSLQDIDTQEDLQFFHKIIETLKAETARSEARQ